MTEPSIIKTVGCTALHRASLSGDVELIDVRSVEEYRALRAAGARNVPLETLDPGSLIRSRTSSPEKPLYFICAVGARSAWACEMMMAAGYDNVVNVEGGTQAWFALGLPVQEGA